MGVQAKRGPPRGKVSSHGFSTPGFVPSDSSKLGDLENWHGMKAQGTSTPDLETLGRSLHSTREPQFPYL